MRVGRRRKKRLRQPGEELASAVRQAVKGNRGPVLGPGAARRGWRAPLLCGLVAAAAAIAVWRTTRRSGPAVPDSRPQASAVLPAGRTADPAPHAGGSDEPRDAKVPASLPSAAPRKAHPLLQTAKDVVLDENDAGQLSSAPPHLADLIRTLCNACAGSEQLPHLTIDYPHDGTIVPPEIVPLTFLWHEPAPQADTWLVEVAFENLPHHLYALVPGDPPPTGPVDPQCLAENNKLYEPTPYQASARSWTPDGPLWDAMKRRSTGNGARVDIVGFDSQRPAQPLSRGSIAIATSQDPVGAPIFYRDVPLAPSMTERGVIKPLGDTALGLIAWRLRDISQPQSRLLLTSMPTCANCHSFSADGKTLAMDLDGPRGDKGAYVIAPITPQMRIEQAHVMTWNSFTGKPPGHKTIGFLSQISPDGEFTVTTLNEALYVCNFLDYRFLQVFYPTRGILAYYRRRSGEIRSLPGADDPAYVHCDPAWTPDGKHLIFARALAKDPYPPDGKLAKYPNDPLETPIQYDLYRIPFNDGRGGRPEPVTGASGNGMSNTFPKVSPDGKWIVFVQCRNGQLMRPDGKLWIVPAAGGTARLMRCNTSLMNSWHSFSPNGRWMVFSSKANTPYTQMFLTHIDAQGNDSPPVLIPDSTASNRAVNIPEFVNLRDEDLVSISVPAVQDLQRTMQGIELARQGKLDEAMAEFGTAMQLRPGNLDAYVNSAIVLLDKGAVDEAINRLTAALRVNPRLPHAHGNLGVALARKGLLDQAIAHFEAALKIDPNYLEAHANMGRALQAKGQLADAEAHFRAALGINPKDPLAHVDLGGILLETGDMEQALRHFRRALELDPRLLEARLLAARSLAARQDFAACLAELNQAAQMAPDHPLVAGELAWLLATCPQGQFRDGPRALALAERACQATGFQQAESIAALAAACAEMGRFPEAVAAASKALALARQSDPVLARSIQRQLQQYEEGKAYRGGR